MLLAGMLTAAPGLLRAQEPTFGAAGQKVVFGGVGIELDFGNGLNDELQTDWTVDVVPGILYFVARNLAVGCALRGSYADYAATAFPYTESELGGSIGLGVNLPLSPRLSFFPRLWLGAGHMRREYDAVTLPTPRYEDPSFATPELPTTLEGGFAIGEFGLPLQLQLGSAAFLAFGPSVRLRLPFEDGSSIFRVGLTTSVGGFF